MWFKVSMNRIILTKHQQTGDAVEKERYYEQVSGEGKGKRVEESLG
jgi:hypothetical protein